MPRFATLFILLTLVVAAAPGEPPAEGQHAGGPLRVDSVVVTLIEQVEVSAREAGQLSEMAVREGQAVDAGATLARIDDSEARLAYEKARLQLDIARHQAADDVKVRYAKKLLEVAAAEEQRGTESVEKFKKSVSQTELDELRLAKQRAALEIEQAEHDQEIAQLTARLKENEVATAQNSVERHRVTAPIAGVVVQIKRRRGEWVQPGDVVLRILRMDRLRAEAFLNSREVAGNMAGRPVTLSVDLPGAPGTKFPGKITFVDPEVNPVNGQFRVWAEFENREQLLRPGLHGNLTIDAAE